MATIKEHYDNHLGNFYSWTLGDFETRKDEFKKFCIDHQLEATPKSAIDLGAGNGLHAMALAELGFSVKAIDFNKQLLDELKQNMGNNSIEAIESDLKQFRVHTTGEVGLLICMGDTLSHLGSFDELEQLMLDSYQSLSVDGKVLLTFRDYSEALEGDKRFIPVKQDQNRMLTCMLEYFPEKVRVTDLLFEKENEGWQQKISSYDKLRLTKKIVLDIPAIAALLFYCIKRIGYPELLCGKIAG